jgi:hypothetical protein
VDDENERAEHAASIERLSSSELEAEIRLLEVLEAVAEERLADVAWQLAMQRAFAADDPPPERP